MSDLLQAPSLAEVAVLFTGGRDSSLVAAQLALKGHNVHLLTCASGTSYRSELSDFRVTELKDRFPAQILGRQTLTTFGIFRRIAIADIESDFRRYGVNLILLGEKLACHAAATVYCLERGIQLLADGCNSYQSHLAEQMPVAIRALQQFEIHYGIEYFSPISDYQSEERVRYELLDMGISTKSLEGISLFGDSFSDPTPETVQAYIADKIRICHDYIDRLGPSNSESLT